LRLWRREVLAGMQRGEDEMREEKRFKSCERRALVLTEHGARTDRWFGGSSDKLRFCGLKKKEEKKRLSRRRMMNWPFVCQLLQSSISWPNTFLKQTCLEFRYWTKAFLLQNNDVRHVLQRFRCGLEALLLSCPACRYNGRYFRAETF
jgi:hypothetical protein